jgi:hypothetical protein
MDRIAARHRLIHIPVVQGIVRRRILVNFRVDPAVIERQLPSPFRPQLVAGSALAGICLIRLEQLRPGHLPAALGVSSENAAHRVAVTWTDAAGTLRRGVYIPRRDTDSGLNRLLGGRLFPGEHQRARFRAREAGATIELTLETADGCADVWLRARTDADTLPASSGFASLAAASAFFAAGSVGYSPSRDAASLDGLELVTPVWTVRALDVQSVVSTYFADASRFPPGSVAFDSALIMRDLPHEWRPVPGPAAPAHG